VIFHLVVKSGSASLLIENCPLCESAVPEILADYRDFTWVSCSCGLIYKRSELILCDADNIYNPSYFKGGNAKHAHAYDRRTKRRIKKSQKQIQHALRYTEPGNLLDIGCSLGYTLKAAKNLGLTAYGIDISQYAVDKCREEGLQVEIGGLDNIPYPDETFSIVVMKHVLEHTIHPVRALREVRRVMKPGGAIFIAVPNANYIKARLNPAKSRFYRPETRGGTEHYVYYTPRTLSQMLEQNGITVQKVHPHLIGARSSVICTLAELPIVPLKFIAETVLSTLGLRKEFWISGLKNGLKKFEHK